ncbi:MAG: hypothetical protein AAF629_13380 [Chloroflexota bacterium]
MIRHKSKLISIIFISTILISSLVQLNLNTPAVQAGPSLPSRPTLTPTPSNVDHAGDNNETPPGAYIELTSTTSSLGAQTIVQWQGSDGNWHNVEGWRSTTFEETIRWWVHPKDFGSGPFRWITQSEHGVLQNQSQPFYLPAFPNQVVQIAIE